MRSEGKVQVQVRPQLQEECLEQPNLLLGECLEQLPAQPVHLARAHLTNHSLELVVLELLPRLQLLQLLEALVLRQVKLVDSLEPNQPVLEHLQQPLLPLHLALDHQQPKQAACLASQPSRLEQLHQPLEQPRLPLGSELRPPQAQALEALVLPQPSQPPPLASLEVNQPTNLLSGLAHLLQPQRLVLVVVLEPHLPQVFNYREINMHNLYLYCP